MNVPARNGPCPCGSGKRYKACHGALGVSPVPQHEAATRLLHEGLAQQQARRLDDARESYERALAILPDAADGWHMLGVIALERGEIETARDHVVRALDLTGWRVGAMRHNLGLILSRRNADVDDARARQARERYRAFSVGRATTTASGATPLVSIVVPSYNHSAYVEQALRSVFAQTYRALELVVVDDGSTDGSPAAIERVLLDAPFPHRLVRQRNQGAAAAINRGIALANGAFVNLLNSDDAFAPERIAQLVAATATRGASWGFSGLAIIDGASRPVDPLAQRRAFDLLCSVHRVPLQETVGFAFLAQNAAVSSGNLFFARALCATIGPLPDLRYNHDWYFCLQALKHAEPVFVPAPLYAYRLHENNTIAESTSRPREEAHGICADYLRWARTVAAPENPFAPAVATWGPLFVNAVLGGGLGELLSGEELKDLVLHAIPGPNTAIAPS